MEMESSGVRWRPLDLDSRRSVGRKIIKAVRQGENILNCRKYRVSTASHLCLVPNDASQHECGIAQSHKQRQRQEVEAEETVNSYAVEAGRLLSEIE